jgi:hypothetical protein
MVKQLGDGEGVVQFDDLPVLGPDAGFLIELDGYDIVTRDVARTVVVGTGSHHGTSEANWLGNVRPLRHFR